MQCCIVSIRLHIYSNSTETQLPPTQPPTVQCTVQRWTPFLSAQWCKDDLKASGSRESPYTPVWHYMVRKACWESSQRAVWRQTKKGTLKEQPPLIVAPRKWWLSLHWKLQQTWTHAVIRHEVRYRYSWFWLISLCSALWDWRKNVTMKWSQREKMPWFIRVS